MLETITALEALLTLVPLAENVATQIGVLIGQLKGGATGNPPTPQEQVEARDATESLIAQIRADVA